MMVPLGGIVVNTTSTANLIQQFEAACSETPSLVSAELEVALLINHFINPLCIRADIERQLELLWQNLESEAQALADPTENLLVGFRRQGFCSTIDVPLTKRHSGLEYVLQDKVGLPILMAILLQAAALRMGCDACGLNAPGHFLLRIEDQVIDPLGLERLDVQASAHPQTDARAVALRMLNNLKSLALQPQGQDISEALAIIDIQLGLAGAPLQAGLYYERGDIWANLGMPDTARDAFENCLRVSADDALSRAAEAQLEKLKHLHHVVH